MGVAEERAARARMAVKDCILKVFGGLLIGIEAEEDFEEGVEGRTETVCVEVLVG